MLIVHGLWVLLLVPGQHKGHRDQQLFLWKPGCIGQSEVRLKLLDELHIVVAVGELRRRDSAMTCQC